MAAKKTTNKKLTLDLLMKDSNKYDKMEKVTFDGGLFIEVCRNFSNEKIDFILQETVDFLDKSQANETLEKLEVEDIVRYLNLHLVIFGTSIGIDNNFTYEEKVQIFEKSVKSDYFEMILQKFDANDLSKTLNRMQSKVENFVEMLKDNPAMQKEFNLTINEANETHKLEEADEEDANVQ